jgi:hypothetical protein
MIASISPLCQPGGPPPRDLSSALTRHSSIELPHGVLPGLPESLPDSHKTTVTARIMKGFIAAVVALCLTEECRPQPNGGEAAVQDRSLPMSIEGSKIGSASIGDPPHPPTTVSSFKVLHVQPTTITSENGEVVDLEWEFELYFPTVYDGPFIVSFLLEEAIDLHLIMSMNEVRANWIYNPGPERVVQHVLEGAGRDGANRFTLSVYQGSMRFANLIIWYLVVP